MFIPFAVHHGRLDLTNWFQIVQVGDHFLGSGLAIVQSSHLSLNDAFSIFFAVLVNCTSCFCAWLLQIAYANMGWPSLAFRLCLRMENRFCTFSPLAAGAAAGGA